ncbi:MAG: hypothetical protein A2Z68_00265 [Candidatus Nealsonbacteria bacterium RBG_13_38_11]|uniref:Calx-beta domain-containing protein n=1 Tax=Candidatus Nealsonbacteria bacterium RBG_13_38_11 TaxID=1801662 RepID=A0A1G2DXN2_9BACT|nr:MAG: hypothetical protein A2Z68_00265 [Candidatus Nealsonbacteria bacterium RBG_13_38_11]
MSQNKKIFIKTIVSFVGTGLVAFALLFFAGVSTVKAANPTIQFTAATSSAAESATPASLGLTLSVATGSDATVDYALTGTATGGGVDYTKTATGTATITAGNTTTTIDIIIVNDTLDENDETIILTLSNPANSTLGANTVHTYTITDNDTAPTIHFTAATSSAAENVTPASVELVSSAASGLTVSVDYALTGTATGGGIDYTLNAGTATITAGNTTTTIEIVIVDDVPDEDNETIILTISNPTNATLATNTVHTYTIIDDDISAYIAGGTSGGSTPGEATATPSAGGETTITTTDGTIVSFEVPANVLTDNTVLTITPVVKTTGSISTAVIAVPVGKLIVGSFIYNVNAVAEETTVKTFGQPVTLTFTYTDSQIAGLNESSIKAYYWDTATSKWIALTTTVNIATNTLTVPTTHLTYFAIMGEVAASVAKPVSQMTIVELQAEIARITALITGLQVQMAQFQGGVTIPSLCAGIAFSRNLSQEMIGNDVKCLQSILNQSADTQIAVSGVGSSGNETNYFGALTKAAVIKFQGKYKTEILTPVGLSAGTGFVGSSTRAKLNALLGK